MSMDDATVAPLERRVVIVDEPEVHEVGDTIEFHFEAKPAAEFAANTILRVAESWHPL